MKKTIPFNLFGKQQELRFTISGLAAFERVQGKSIQQIVQSENAGFNFCLNALPICLEKLNQHLYEEKIEKYLDEEGHTLDDIAVPIIEAIAISGALGKQIADNVARKYYPELYPEPAKEEETEKNE